MVSLTHLIAWGRLLTSIEVTAMGASPVRVIGVRFVTVSGVVTRKATLVLGASAWRYSFRRAAIQALMSEGLTAAMPLLTKTWYQSLSRAPLTAGSMGPCAMSQARRQ